MAAGDEHAAAEVLRGLARHLNCLNEDNKSTRKRAIELIKRETIDKGLSSSVLQEVFVAILKPLLKCLSDPMERCRETAITIITEFIRCVPKPEECLPYLMPCLAQRLGEKEIQEPAEELRLSCVEMLTLTSEVCGKHLAPYLSEMVNILQRTIVDPFPDVKRESCTCIINFAKCVPGSLLLFFLLMRSVAMVTGCIMWQEYTLSLAKFLFCLCSQLQFLASHHLPELQVMLLSGAPIKFVSMTVKSFH